MSTNGKFLLYSAKSLETNSRLEIVRDAVRRIAEKLELKVEITRSEATSHVFVFYKSSRGEEIPVYSDFGKRGDIEEVYSAIINMMFVLSFHPKHSMLKAVRREVMQFS